MARFLFAVIPFMAMPAHGEAPSARTEAMLARGEAPSARTDAMPTHGETLPARTEVIQATATMPASADSSGRLEAACIIDCVDQTAEAVLTRVAREAGRSLWVDHAAAERIRSARVTLHARRLRRIDGLQWAARLAGVELVRIGDRLAVFMPESAPEAWLAGGAAEDSAGEASSAEASAWERRADLNLVDVTVRAFCRAVEQAYDVDVYVAPGLAQCQELIEIEGRGVRLREAAARAGRQLKASLALIDGMLVVDTPGGPTGGRAARSAAGRESVGAGLRGDGRRLRFAAVRIGWAEIADRARDADCDVTLPVELANRTVENVVADGPADAVVAALLLSEGVGATRAVGKAAEHSRSVPEPLSGDAVQGQ